MSVFSAAMAVVWMHEVDPKHPNKVTVDTGGTTKYGISCEWAKAIVPDCTDEFIKNLTVQQARDLYEKHFWAPYAWDKITSQTVATKLFDMAVNMGPERAIRIGQQALCDCGQTVKIDGLFGGKTLSAIEACDPVELVGAIVDRHTMFYKSLATTNPQRYGMYLQGWLVRASWPGKGKTK